MDQGQRLLSIRREWPGELAVITDLGPRSAIPDESDQAALATASGDIIAAALRHERDGTAVAEVWQGPAPDDLTCAYACQFHTASGAVILGDAHYEEQAVARIGAGTHRLRILTNETERPGLVAFEFTPQPRGVLPLVPCRSRGVRDRATLRSRVCGP
ncbi:hypothetical protein KM427_13060 [Nocardioides sp. LMS-CY]|uniref:hypothetical protein n=1 Tax=Nocardioides sp. (strain LMS-CY) TaxID=2840457 RepID=UPI001BFFFFAA|nr:hypothetical protein [Nocardioides sp. LMS-CY]QWF19955.1 hypothetical protein KM427_13060 [Nocardioides sp. LMS-CY]